MPRCGRTRPESRDQDSRTATRTGAPKSDLLFGPSEPLRAFYSRPPDPVTLFSPSRGPRPAA